MLCAQIGLGRNAHISWGETTVGADAQDLFVINEVNTTHYRVDNDILAYDIQNITIKVKVVFQLWCLDDSCAFECDCGDVVVAVRIKLMRPSRYEPVCLGPSCQMPHIARCQCLLLMTMTLVRVREVLLWVVVACIRVFFLLSYAEVEAYGVPLALRWIAIDPSIEDKSMQGLLMANKAKNYNEFKEACALGISPSFESIYADVEGNIGYFVCQL